MNTTMPVDHPLPPLDAVELSSLTGVIIATTVIMTVLNRALADVAVLKRVPAFVYVTGIAMVLTFVASRVLHTLPGSTGLLLWEAAKAALASSGFYTWVSGRAGPIASVGPAAAADAPVPPPTPTEPRSESGGIRHASHCDTAACGPTAHFDELGRR